MKTCFMISTKLSIANMYICGRLGRPPFPRFLHTSIVKSSEGNSNRDNVPTTQNKDTNNLHHTTIGRQPVRITPTKKRFLMLSGRWKRASDIPESLPGHQYNNDMWVVRIRVAAFIMVFWLVTCLVLAKIGRKHVKERSHQVVMQQYLEGLNPEERERFAKEFNLEKK